MIDSEWKVEVIRVGTIEKHTNADSLSIIMVHGGYPVIFRTGDFKEGDLAVYVPIEAIVPDEPQWSFLEGHRRIKAKRLRGVFSMGLLTPVRDGMKEGQDVAAELGIVRWVPKQSDGTPSESGERDDIPDPLPKYNSAAQYRRHKNALIEGEEVVITEKIHGENARFCWKTQQHLPDWLQMPEFVVCSRTRRKLGGRMGWFANLVSCLPMKAKRWLHRYKPMRRWFGHSLTPFQGKWWEVARRYGLEEICKKIPNVIVHGEAYGYTGGFPYGVENPPAFVCFDLQDRKTGRYYDWDEQQRIVTELGLPTAPVLYRGPWSPELVTTFGSGPTTLGGKHTREGIVIRPVVERNEMYVGRMTLKYHCEEFLLQMGRVKD